MIKESRITIFAGHYGSGKTNLAVNYALFLKKAHGNVALVDMDIVNPYFRSRDSERELTENGILFISSAYANTNVDVPSVPAQANRIFDDRELFSVMDVGGDDRGAYALGRYAEKLKLEESVSMLLVVNRFRPLTADADGAFEIMKEIEHAAGVPFTGIVNNSNLGVETEARHVLESAGYAREISEITGLPIVFTSVKRELAGEVGNDAGDLFPLEIMHKPGWIL
jgi:MinD-like ATPase involved in chromosome partitioning or flagellar assembly